MSGLPVAQRSVRPVLRPYALCRTLLGSSTPMPRAALMRLHDSVALTIAIACNARQHWRSLGAERRKRCALQI